MEPLRNQNRVNKLQLFLALITILSAIFVLVAVTLTQIDRASRTTNIVSLVESATPAVQFEILAVPQTKPISVTLSFSDVSLSPEDIESYSVTWNRVDGSDISDGFVFSRAAIGNDGEWRVVLRSTDTDGSGTPSYQLISQDELQAQATTLANTLDIVRQSQQEIEAQSTRVAQITTSSEESAFSLPEEQLEVLESQQAKLSDLESVIELDQQEIQAQSTRLAQMEKQVDPVAVALIQRDLEVITSGIENIEDYFDSGIDRLQRDIDRLYSIVIGTVITLLVSIGATTVVPLLQRSNPKKNSDHQESNPPTSGQG